MWEILCFPSPPTTSHSPFTCLASWLRIQSKSSVLSHQTLQLKKLTGFSKSTADILCHLHFTDKCRFPPYFSASHIEPEWKMQLHFVQIFWILMLGMLFQNPSKVTSPSEPEFLLHRGSCYAEILSKEHQNLLIYSGRNKIEITFEVTLIGESILPLSPPKHYFAFKAFFQWTPLSQNK